jgi:hypothetical protein
MIKPFIACVVVPASLVTAHALAGTVTNLALGAPVSLVSGSPSGAALSTLTDGIFRPAGTQWQNGTVWWSGTSTLLEIGLGGPVEVAGAVVQADNNDTYRMWNRDLGTGTFLELWTIGAVGGAGMRTRPNATNDGEVFFFPSSVVTDAIRIAAIGGDSSYSLSEVQVWGAVPGPGAIGFALVAGLASRRCRREA